jgi:hypothetical protein
MLLNQQVKIVKKNPPPLMKKSEVTFKHMPTELINIMLLYLGSSEFSYVKMLNREFNKLI